MFSFSNQRLRQKGSKQIWFYIFSQGNSAIVMAMNTVLNSITFQFYHIYNISMKHIPGKIIQVAKGVKQKLHPLQDSLLNTH
jgi:hypothetical protein